jgi:hypothetical protein
VVILLGAPQKPPGGLWKTERIHSSVKQNATLRCAIEMELKEHAYEFANDNRINIMLAHECIDSKLGEG